MAPPFGVDLVVRLFDLVTNDRGRLPGGIECKRLFGVDGANQKVVEEMPLTAVWCLWFSMGN